MNLFVETLADSLKGEWDRVLLLADGPREARFIVESVSPQNAFALFAALEAHRAEWGTRARIECHFRIATGLWQEWRRSHGVQQLDREMAGLGGLGSAGERRWIDEEDRLTWYRNRTRSQGIDGLVIVLLGLSHASDRGGLGSFHRVDEARIWQELGCSFVPWIERMDKRLGLSGSPREFEQFDEVLHGLFDARPLQLERLAGFLESEVIADGRDLCTLSDVLARLYARLPFWDIPPFFSAKGGKKHAELLKSAADFISHKRFKNKSDQKKAWEKLENAFGEDEIDLPETAGDAPLYSDLNSYRDTLNSFIFDADTTARRRLLQTDIEPVLRILSKPKEKKSTSPKPARLKGLGLEVFLRAIWITLSDIQRQPGRATFADQLESIRIEIEGLKHDLQSDDTNGIGGNALAKSLLQGCLGGLPDALAKLDLRLPADSDQAEELPDAWERTVQISLTLDFDTLKYGTSRARPHLQFKVYVKTVDGDRDLSRPFQWSLDPTQPERVLIECAKTVLARWDEWPDPDRLLPSFQISPVTMTALYYAADEDEANRLVSQALTEMRLVNLLDGLTPGTVEPGLWALATDLSRTYRDWLRHCVERGWYHAITEGFLPLLSRYEALAKRVLDSTVLGSAEMLRRFYKAFLLMDDSMSPNDGYLRSAIVLGISPPVLELTHARQRFLFDGFPEVAAELALGRDGRSAFERLLGLAEIHRPLAGLVVDRQRGLCAEIKSFGLLHHLGPERAAEKSLAVQTLLREDESDEDADVAELIAHNDESDVVVQVLADYRQLYPFADDGIRILAVHVKELGTILSGVDRFLRDYLKSASKDWPAFHCEVMVYTTSASPMAMESRLSAWRHALSESYRERGRPLVLSVGHRYVPKSERKRERMVELLQQEAHLYDIAFLFRFLEGELAGEAEPALPFELDFNSANLSQFPICEYPRPIRHGDALRRESLLSNRRLRIQTWHADLSARLRHPQDPHSEHLIFGHIDYEPWQDVVEGLHKKAQWVACIDPFVDKRLLRTAEGGERRKIVGFTSGLGDYGELNLSISTEQDTLSALADLVHGQLVHLLPFEDAAALAPMAERAVDEAEEIIGLSSLRAVVGDGERIREVVGFAAIRRALATPPAAMSQLLPIDSLLHWFEGSELPHRPDLLALSLTLREGDIPLVHATVIECKFGLHNPAHLAKASDQVLDGLSHLTELLAPNRGDIRRVRFDRRYWWAQLQRAVTSRSVVTLADRDWRELDRALERVAEGYYEIAWQGAIFTFWTNEPGPEPVVTPLALPAGTIRPPFELPHDFAIKHVALGYRGVLDLFSEPSLLQCVDLGDRAIRLRAAGSQAADHTAHASQPQADDRAQTGAGAADAPARERASAETGDRPAAGPAPSERTSGSGLPTAAPLTIGQSRPPAPGLGARLTSLVRNAFPARDRDRDRDRDRTDGDSAAPIGSATPETGAVIGPAKATARQPEPTVATVAEEPPAEPPVARLEFAAESTPRVLERLSIGTRSNGEPVYWHYGHPALANRHLLVFGSTGSGKTYGIQCLLAEMAAQGLHSLIVDYTDGFLPGQVEPRFAEVANPKDHFVVTERLPLNPFRRQRQVIDPSVPAIEESPYQVATRVASIFTSIYSTIGDQQFPALIRVLENGIASDRAFSLKKLLERLPDEGQYGNSLASKLEPLIKASPFREGVESAWAEMLAMPGRWVQVLQLKGLGREIQKMVTELALWDLYDYACSTGSKHRPIPVVLDEIQNLDHRSDSPIDKMLREGRKFGLSLILATQTASNFTQEQRDRLFQAGHKLFFKPADTEIERFAGLLAQSTRESKGDWAQRLASLEKGKCWSLGPVPTSSGNLQDKPVLVSVTALEKRTFGHGS